MRWSTESAQQSNMYGMLPYMCCRIFGILYKHSSLPVGSIQPSSPSTKQLHGQSMELSCKMTNRKINHITSSSAKSQFILLCKIFNDGLTKQPSFRLNGEAIWQAIQLTNSFSIRAPRFKYVSQRERKKERLNAFTQCTFLSSNLDNGNSVTRRWKKKQAKRLQKKPKTQTQQF